jgi:hypothetical protein
VVYPKAGDECPAGTKAIPMLTITLTYDVPAGSSFSLDAFPEQKHNPITDHAVYVDVMPDDLMNVVVGCINQARTC